MTEDPVICGGPDNVFIWTYAVKNADGTWDGSETNPTVTFDRLSTPMSLTVGPWNESQVGTFKIRLKVKYQE